MRSIAIVLVVLCFALGTCWGIPEKGMLDGKTYTGMLTSQKNGKTYKESIIFHKGMIRSTACEAMGFKHGKYTVAEKDGVTTVKGSVMNAKGDMNEIEATIKGDDMTGTLKAKMADGTMGETMTLKAALDKTAKKPEHPMKSEHPTSEHPK